MTLLIDIGIVFFWPDGLGLLTRTYDQEVQYLSRNIDERTTELISSWVQSSYELVFVKTGMQKYLHSGGGQLTNNLITGMWPVLQGIMIGFQIFMIRMSVLILMLPFTALIVAVAAADGFTEWYKRRTGGARESAFIYHRSKHMVAWALTGLWVFYLMPPFAVDPVYVFLPTILLLGLFSRLAVQYFKKYL